MKILRATFLGIRGLRDVSLDFEDPETGEPRDLIAITGPAACGKTRLLEAIFAAKEAIAPYGQAIDGQPWIGEGTAAKASITFWLDEEEQTYAGTSNPVAETDVLFFPQRTDNLASEGLRAVLERYTHGARTGKLEYFPTSRRLPQGAPFGDLSARAQRDKRSSKAPDKYAFVGRFLRDLPATPEIAEAFATRLAALSPTCRYAPNGRAGHYFESRQREGVTLGQLSDAESDAVLFAATALAIDLNSSLLLVDRPDLHVDPGDMRGLAAGLRRLGDDNQVIVACGPAFASAAAAEGALAIEIGAS